MSAAGGLYIGVMDIPIYLPNDSELVYVSGYDEFKQSLYLLLKTAYGRFLQSATIGSRVSVHTSDVTLLRLGIKTTVEQLGSCKCESVEVSGDDVLIRVSYGGSFRDYTFNLGSLV